MEFDFLSPLKNDLLDEIKQLNPQTIGAQLKLHSERSGLPDLEGVKVAIFGVIENRRSVDEKEVPEFSSLRSQLYKLYPGNWRLKMADLGDIQPGDTVEDTYFAVQTLVEGLIKQNIIPVI